MTLVGAIVLVGWLVAGAFLYLHSRTQWTKRRAGVAVWVMAACVFVVMTLAVLRTTFGVVLPEWVRALAFLLVIIGQTWKLAALLRYRHGDYTDTDNPHERTSDREETTR